MKPSDGAACQVESIRGRPDAAGSGGEANGAVS